MWGGWTLTNRLRLLPMDGTQAYAVVTESGGALVGDEVARRILRLAWKNEPAPPVEPEEFPRIEIDPALLSVVCSELNHKRLAATPPLPQITPALLAGADHEILAGFYERGVAGLDGRVRAFVEDELITDRGFRDSHDWDDALALPGVSGEALGALIARRLLRVDERLGQRRLELTHDVLTRVVMGSRDRRRAREAEAAALERERVAAQMQRDNRRKRMQLMNGIVLILTLAGFAGWQAWAAHTLAVAARALQAEARSSRLMATADRLQQSQYDASLLVNLEAPGAASTLDAQAGLPISKKQRDTPLRQGRDSSRWIQTDGSWNDRAIHHIQPLVVEYLPTRIDDAVGRSDTHVAAAERMRRDEIAQHRPGRWNEWRPTGRGR